MNLTLSTMEGEAQFLIAGEGGEHWMIQYHKGRWAEALEAIYRHHRCYHLPLAAAVRMTLVACEQAPPDFRECALRAALAGLLYRAPPPRPRPSGWRLWLAWLLWAMGRRGAL